MSGFVKQDSELDVLTPPQTMGWSLRKNMEPGYIDKIRWVCESMTTRSSSPEDMEYMSVDSDAAHGVPILTSSESARLIGQAPAKNMISTLLSRYPVVVGAGGPWQDPTTTPSQ